LRSSSHAAQDLPHHELGLGPIVGRLVDADLVAALPVGEERLLRARQVVRNHAAGPVQDRLGGAVVALQPHHLRLGVVVLEVEDVPEIRSTPCIDRLIGVPDHAEVAVLAGDLLDQVVLHPVGVLVLVDQDVLPAAAVVVEHLGEAVEELRGAKQQVAEVEGVGVGEQALVGRVDLGGALGLEVQRRVAGLGRVGAGVLPLVDPPGHAPRIFQLGVEAVAPQRLLHQAQGIRLVVDGEAAGVSQVPDLAAQDADAGGVEGGEADALGPRAQQLPDPLAHLARRLVGEGDGEDALRRNPAGSDQVGDPVGQDPGLAAPGPGQHQQRPLGDLDGPALLRIEPLEQGR
jgi:hypothetical protein